MLLGKITKQPIERHNYFISYVDYLQTGEIITNAVATVDIAGELVVIGPVVMVTNTDLEFWLEGGVAGGVYKLEFTVTTSFNNVKQDEIKVKVKDI